MFGFVYGKKDVLRICGYRLVSKKENWFLGI